MTPPPDPRYKRITMTNTATDTDERTLSTLWTELAWSSIPLIPDSDTDEDNMLRAVVTESGFIVATFATEHSDRRGQTGIAVAVWTLGGLVRHADGAQWESESLVAWTGTEAAGLVYGSPCHADDSDEALISACALVAYSAQHDANDNTVEPGWDANGLGDDASMAESWLAGDE